MNEIGISMQLISSGSTPASLLANEENCALRVIATVVSTPLPGRAAIDAGSKTLTSDKAAHREGYGYVVGLPGVSISALHEEHGFIEFDPEEVSLKVGDRLEIIPNHSCVIPNLYDFINGVRKGKVTESIKVDARGRNY